VPDALHERIRVLSKENGLSINGLVNVALKKYCEDGNENELEKRVSELEKQVEDLKKK